MSYTLKPHIFGLFGDYFQLTDPNKDISGKGTLQRFNEAVAEDFDEEVMPEIENLVTNLIPALTLLNSHLSIVEESIGHNLYLGPEEVWRRRVLKYIMRLYEIRGTKKCYTLLLNWIGFDVTITEHSDDYTFDSAVTFDDATRVWDRSCQGCSDYTLDLSRIVPGASTLSSVELAAINSIIEFNQPINANLREILFDGSSIGACDFMPDFNNDFLVCGGEYGEPDFNADYSTDYNVAP
jgi:hypothetical protein